MPEKKPDPGFTVTDRRRFMGENEEPSTEAETPKAAEPAAAAPPPPDPEIPAPPSAEARQAQHDAFKESSRKLDEQLDSKLGGRSAQDFEMTFERFIASLYMTALVQLGVMHEQGATPQVDLIGARQTIDTIGLLAEKTKGNLTVAEENLLQNCLYELRMAYVEVTNALTHPQPPGGGTAK